MKIEKLACPTCGAPLPQSIAPNQKVECSSCGSTLVATDWPADTTVTCSECGTINSDEKRFCANCGASLKIDCVLCHAENKLGAVHCIKCGAHLERARKRRSSMQQKRRKYLLEQAQRFKEKEERQKAQKLQKLLDDLDEPENHDMAIFQINQMGVDAVDALIETLLNDHDPDARYGSARALGRICSEHNVKGLIKAKAAKALTKSLADPEPAVRYWSADALGKCQSQVAVEPLARLLKDSHAGVRQHARHALQQIGGKKAQKILSDLDKPKGLIGWIKGN